MANKKVYIALMVSPSSPISSDDVLKGLLFKNLTKDQIREGLEWDHRIIYCVAEVLAVSKWKQEEKQSDNDNDDDTDCITDDYKQQHETETVFINEYVTRKNIETPWAYLLGDVIWLTEPEELEENITIIQSLPAKILRTVIKQNPGVAAIKNKIQRVAIVSVDRWALACIKNKTQTMEIRSKRYRILDPAQKYAQGDNWDLQIRGIESDIAIEVVDQTFREIYFKIFNAVMPQLNTYGLQIFNEIGINEHVLNEEDITMDDIKKYVNVKERGDAAKLADIVKFKGKPVISDALQLELKLWGEIKGKSVTPDPNIVATPYINIESEDEDEDEQEDKRENEYEDTDEDEDEDKHENEYEDTDEDEDEDEDVVLIKKTKKTKKSKKRKRKKEYDPYRPPFKKRKLTADEKKTDTSTWNPKMMIPVGGGDRKVKDIPVIFPIGGPDWTKLKFYCPLTSKYNCRKQTWFAFDKHWYAHQARSEIDDEYLAHRPEIFNSGCMCKKGCLSKKPQHKHKRGVWVSESSWIHHLRNCIEASPEAAPNQAKLPIFAQRYPHHEDVDQYDKDKAAKAAAKAAKAAKRKK